jgi:hypothetical protein
MSGRSSAVLVSVVCVVTAMLLTGAACTPTATPTVGMQWQGDSSACTTVPADDTVQTIGAQVGGVLHEFGSTAGSYFGKPGCDKAYVVDYLMPVAGTNINPRWDWAWIHVASRVSPITATNCPNLWTSLQVYGYYPPVGGAAPQVFTLLSVYRVGAWTAGGCAFGQPDNVAISGLLTKVRAVSQHGMSVLSGEPQYSYFSTNDGT